MLHPKRPRAGDRQRAASVAALLLWACAELPAPSPLEAPDAATGDALVEDAGPRDVGAVDSGGDGAGDEDAGPRDGGAADTGTGGADANDEAVDLGVSDTGSPDGALSDAGANARAPLRCPIRPPPAAMPPAQGVPGDFTRIETPTAWDYREACQDQSLCAASEGRSFEIGPGRRYENPRDVPWLELAACDQVLLHYRAQPYRDIIVLTARGERGRAIVLRGVPGPNGERPTLDGQDAVMPRGTGANSYVDALGLLQIHRPLAGANVRYGYHPGYLLISGLRFQNARAPHMVTDLTGARRPWGTLTSGIYALGVEHLSVNDCDFTGNGVGLFINSTNAEASQSRNVLVRGNHFHDNGVVNGYSQHNAYTEAIGIIYEYNYFAPPLAGSGADNIKERSAGNVFRYNFIHGGINLISLRDPQSNQDHEAAALDAHGQRLASRVFIYANILAATTPVLGRNNSIFLGVGDGTCCGSGAQVRDGRIYFYGNRVYASLPAPPGPGFATRVALFDLLNTRAPTTVEAVNNLFYARDVPFALFYYQGLADWRSNWINQFELRYAPRADGTLAVGAPFDGAGLGGLTADPADPGFLDAPSHDYRTTPGSPFAALRGTLPAEVLRLGLAPTDEPVVRPFGP